MSDFNKIELRGRLRAKFEIETDGMYIETKKYLAWLEDKEVDRQFKEQANEVEKPAEQCNLPVVSDWLPIPEYDTPEWKEHEVAIDGNCWVKLEDGSECRFNDPWSGGLPEYYKKI